MNKPKRYLCGGYVGLMYEFAKGDWVNWSDYALLLDEVERLTIDNRLLNEKVLSYQKLKQLKDISKPSNLNSNK